MKCLCGYEHGRYASKGEGPSILIGDEPFKEITIWVESVICDIKDPKRDNRYIYACPKCGTLKIEI